MLEREDFSPYNDAFLRPPVLPENIHAREVRVAYATEVLVHFFSDTQNTQLISDVDGVIYHQNVTEHPTPTTPGILESMRQLALAGVPIGVATSRGRSVIDSLEDDGVPIRGFSLIEEAQMVICGDETTYLASPKYVSFAQTALARILSHERVRGTWEEAKRKTEETGEIFFYHGNDSQWRGDLRLSPWYPWWMKNSSGETFTPEEAMNLLKTIIRPVRKNSRVKESIDFDIYEGRMDGPNPIGHVRILGRTEDGKVISKANGIELIPRKCVFVADGYRDFEAGREVTRRGGLVVSIEGNLDIADEKYVFHDEAMIVLEDQSEWAEVLLRTAIGLRLKKSREKLAT